MGSSNMEDLREKLNKKHEEKQNKQGVPLVNTSGTVQEKVVQLRENVVSTQSEPATEVAEDQSEMDTAKICKGDNIQDECVIQKEAAMEDQERVASPNQEFHRTLEAKCGINVLEGFAAQIGKDIVVEAIEQSDLNVASILKDWSVSPSPAGDASAPVTTQGTIIRGCNVDSQDTQHTWPQDGTGWDDIREVEFAKGPPVTQAGSTLSEPSASTSHRDVEEMDCGEVISIVSSSRSNVLPVYGKRKMREGGTTSTNTEEDDPTPQIRRKSRISKTRCVVTDDEGTTSRATRSQRALEITENANVENQPRRNAAIDSDQPAQSGSEAESRGVIKKPPPKKNVRRKKNPDEPTIEQLMRPLHTREELQMMTVADAGVAAIEWLEDIDVIRARSSYQGALSGQIRRKVEMVKETLKIFSEKLEDKGDPDYLRRRNAELLAELTASKKESLKMRKDIEDLRRKVEDLTHALISGVRSENKVTPPVEMVQKKKEVSRKKSRSRSRKEEAMEVSTQVQEMIIERGEGTGSNTVNGAAPKNKDTVMRPPLKGVSTPIPAVEKSGLRSQQEHDRSLDAELSRQIVELTNRRRELRQAGGGDRGVGSAPSPSRGKPRVLGNVQIAPPLSASDFPPLVRRELPLPPVQTGEGEWTTITGGKRKKKKLKQAANKEETGFKEKIEAGMRIGVLEKGDGKEGNKGTRREQAPAPATNTKRRRPPRTAAVAIKGIGENFSYSAALRQLRDKISLPELGISKTSIRHSANGGILIEVPGPGKEDKAEALKQVVSGQLGDAAVVTRPVIKGDIRLIGLDDSVVTEEIADVISAEGGCKSTEVKVGAIRPMRNGLFTAWAQCPLEAAIKAAQKEKIKVGWTMVRIELLKARPTQCYRCWGHGHLRVNCTSTIDRSRICYRCGEEGHSALRCTNPVNCALCKTQGKEAGHRVGSAQCGADFRMKNEARSVERMDTEEPAGGPGVGITGNV